MKIYSQILSKIILPISEFIFNIPITHELNKLDKLTKLSEIELEKLQQQKLSKLLLHSVSKSDYYKNLKIEIDEILQQQQSKTRINLQHARQYAFVHSLRYEQRT